MMMASNDTILNVLDPSSETRESDHELKGEAKRPEWRWGHS